MPRRIKLHKSSTEQQLFANQPTNIRKSFWNRVLFYFCRQNRLLREQNSTAWRRYSRPKQLSFPRFYFQRTFDEKTELLSVWATVERQNSTSLHGIQSGKGVGYFIYIHIKTQFLGRPLALTDAAATLRSSGSAFQLERFVGRCSLRTWTVWALLGGKSWSNFVQLKPLKGKLP